MTKAQIRVKTFLLIGLFCYPAFYLLDFFYYPQFHLSLLALRSIFVAFILMMLAILRKIPEKYLSSVLALFFILGGFSISYMTIIVHEGFNSIYFVGNMIFILAIAVAAENFLIEFLLPSSLILLFHFTLLFNGPHAEGRTILASFAFLFGNTFVGFLLNRYVNQIRKREIALNEKNQYFVKIFAHDIKNHLNTGTLSLIMAQKKNPESKYIKQSLEDHKDMNRIVGNLINIFSEEELILNKGMVQMDWLIDSFHRRWKVKFENRNVEFIIQNASIESIFVDEEYMELLWENLFANAYQNTPVDGIFILKIFSKDNTIHFAFCNSGPVVPESLRPALFEKFLSKEKHTVYNKGLGLNYSKMMAQQHGGDLIFEVSEEGYNSFVVKLPKE